MILYASRTGTRRNLEALRKAGWRLMVSRTGVWRTEGFAYALDNGAWTDHQQKRDFDGGQFKALVERLGRDADWIVAPDIVAGGRDSLERSLSWLPYLLDRTQLVLIPAQDGLEPTDMVSVLGPRVGVFLGGSTEWKEEVMMLWGAFCVTTARCHFHVGRVNSARRLYLARGSGAQSIDGSSPSRFAINVHALTLAGCQADLFTPQARMRALD